MRVGAAVLAGLLLLGAVVAMAVLRNAPEDASGRPASPPLPAPGPMGDAWAPADPGAHRKLVLGLRYYLDLDEDIWAGRKAFDKELRRLAANDVFPLADPRLLRWLVEQGRSFALPLDDPRYLRSESAVVRQRGETGFEVQHDTLHVHVREPNRYARQRLHRFPRPAPWPVVVALHDDTDAASTGGPGRSWLDRHWHDDDHQTLRDDWFAFVPISSDGRFSDGMRLTPDKVFGPLRQLWSRYHIDFDRVVLDGGQDALLGVVTNATAFLAGLVLRDVAVVDGQIANAKIADSLVNITHLPVYVVDRPDLAKALRAAGLRHVVEGDGRDTLVDWMGRRRRHLPRRFDWEVVDADQQVAYWVSIDQPLWEAPRRTLTAAVREDDSNTIDIDAVGMTELSVFLDDTLVDLDRPVRLVINGTLVWDDRTRIRARYVDLMRDLKEIFELPPVNVRKHRYYGWLKPASIIRMSVPRQATGAPPRREGEGATHKQEADAERLHRKATTAMASGNTERARKLLRRILRLPPTKRTKDARRLLEDLRGK